MSCRSNVSNVSNNGCVNSACELKDIIDRLDNLNTQDLCILKDLIGRILSCNSCNS